MTEQFKKDSARGAIGQKYVADLMRSWGATVSEVPDKYFPDFDLIANGKTIEVKHDWKAEETGNICLELEALWHSKAQFLAVVTGNPIKHFYLVPLQEALRLAESWPKTNVGEYNGPAALVPVRAFVEHLNAQVLTTN